MTFNFPTLRGIIKTLKDEEDKKQPLTVEDATYIIDALTAKIERLEREMKQRR